MRGGCSEGCGPPDLHAYLSRWLKSTFTVSWLGSGSSWISFFTVCSLQSASLISVQRQVEVRVELWGSGLVCWDLLMASTNRGKNLKGNSGSGSSLKNIFRAPVTTWMSSHWLWSRSRGSSGGASSRQQGGPLHQPLEVLAPTLIHKQAELLDGGQVPAHSVDAVHLQA